jgi:hypothetical protein
MESTAQVWRRWKRGLVLIAAIYTFGLVSTFGWLLYKNAVHRRWYEHVNCCILRLAPKRPPDVPAGQWAHCILWTWNLHANYGGATYFPEEQREPFVADFERHLMEPVTLATIDAIWDDYATRAPKAQNYMHFRPTTSEMLVHAGRTQDSLDTWLEQLKECEKGR